ncbi:twin-arginine translocase TatA/TatE family subunit [Lacimicrobium alkaliphilum]|uniref:Sec-independent protein translocase protein TatA n=1 Tax=Lacimicrobium alkaliphilum TaxID=1526571 RepID=A0ABQ1RQZ3_9ALTE|nr:twin-arginine translocase TatA/TatE family subunit [Lacimicrobium alkaliphilum]GGD76472.1 Sec-independent protein translocase protein TatA [Lacimicrobium alkaliphilum]
MGGISLWQLLIIFAIVLLLFGTKRLRTLGSDLGSAIKGFKKEIDPDKETSSDADFDQQKVENKRESTAQTQSEKQKQDS